jgi:DNA polymerase I-like protein with 3'-5' exonuclease and polymerase domains
MLMPNVRDIYIPDPGYTIFDVDLKAADAMVVAWESGCRLLKEWLNEGLDIYTQIAREYYHERDIVKSDPRRGRFKSLCHATHYLGIAANIAGNSNIGLSVTEVARVQDWYFKLCPEIKQWHERLIANVNSTHTVSNAFGYRFTYYTRIDHSTYNAAAAWIPQSTVANVIDHAMVNIDENLPDVQLLIQVHDSLVGQYPTEMPELQAQILEQSKIVVPYPDLLIIPPGIKTSLVSWGACK